MYHKLKLTPNNLFAALSKYNLHSGRVQNLRSLYNQGMQIGALPPSCEWSQHAVSLKPEYIPQESLEQVTHCYLVHIVLQLYAPIFFCCLKRRFRAVISGWRVWKFWCPMQASCTSCKFYQPSYLREEMEFNEKEKGKKEFPVFWTAQGGVPKDSNLSDRKKILRKPLNNCSIMECKLVATQTCIPPC